MAAFITGAIPGFWQQSVHHLTGGAHGKADSTAVQFPGAQGDLQMESRGQESSGNEKAKPRLLIAIDCQPAFTEPSRRTLCGATDCHER